MQLLKLTSLACIALTLGACQSLFQPNMRAPLEVKREAWEKTQPGCTEADCPLVNVDTVHFPAEPALDALVERSLLQMTVSQAAAKPAPTLQAYQEQFLRQAENRNSSYLQAKVREQHDGLVILELASYLDTGGAHGMPGRGFINYSRQTHQVLTLQDMLVPGQEQAFWNLVKVAHNRWQASNNLDRDPEFVKSWPFQTTPNIALTSSAVVAKYNVNAIAPYSMGLIEVTIPYSRLRGVIKPELFPGHS